MLMDDPLEKEKLLMEEGGSITGMSKSQCKNPVEELASARSTDSSSLEQEGKQSIYAQIHVGEQMWCHVREFSSG